jgi:alpha-mannosidase
VPEQTVPECPGARCQWIEGVDGRRRLAVSGFDLPALGGRVLALTVGEPELDSAFAIDGNTVETPFARVEFDRFGRIVSLRDRGCDREIVAEDGALNTFWLGEDVPQSWDNWDIDSDQHLKMEREDHLLETAIMADGPLQLRLRRVYAIGQGSRLTQDMVFHADTAQIDFETVLDWEEKHRLLKVGFELAVTTETARHEIQYGHVERPTHTNHPQDRARFEVCAHKWTDLSDNGFGVALLNDCKYGLSVRENELRLSLVKSGVHPDPRGDAGRHYFTYSLVPHSGTFSVPSVVRPAYELNSDILVVPAGRIAEGICPLVEVDAESVIVEAVKWADEEEAFVLRLFEAGRGSTRARLRFGTPVAEVLETDMLEENGTQLDIDDHSVEVCFGPFEIKTLVCRLP